MIARGAKFSEGCQLKKKRRNETKRDETRRDERIRKTQREEKGRRGGGVEKI